MEKDSGLYKLPPRSKKNQQILIHHSPRMTSHSARASTMTIASIAGFKKVGEKVGQPEN